ncbi:MAG: NifU family protein [Treponema sp.]|nr:NifU family protein [Treponema sp.]
MADQSLEEKVKETLEAFRPQLNADGGDLEYINIDDENKVHIRLTGACGNCPMAVMTLKMGIERYLKETVPEVAEVVQEL